MSSSHKSSTELYRNDKSDDEVGPAYSPGKERDLPSPSPSAMLTEALKNLQSDPNKTAAAARALLNEQSSPEPPMLTGVLRRRQPRKGNKDAQNIRNKSTESSSLEDSGGDYGASAIREAANRAISASVSAMSYSESISKDGASGNNVNTSLSLPSQNGSIQCTDCLKKISMLEMAEHIKVCPLRYEQCR